ncbi:MAG: hypothetical protein ABI614_12560, partial [Planctomycetota bacterium]
MSCKWMLQMTLATAMTVSLTAPLAAQYQGYPSPSPYNTPAPQRAQLPSWYSPLPPVTQSQPYNAPSQPAAPYAYSPSEMPSVSPFANVRSRDQQTPASYGGTQYQPASQHPPTSQYQPAPQSYYAYPASASDSQQHAVGGGIPNSLPAYSPPAKEMMASPQQHSYYDQPAQNHSSPPDYGFDAKGAGGSSLVGPAMGIRNGWYGGAVGMYMTRSRANNLWLSYDITDIRDRVLNSNDAANSWAGGAGANIGHYFNCGQNSIQFIYWGLYPGVSEANAYGANTASGIDTIMHFDGLRYNPGAGAQDVSNFYFNAERHRVQRNYQLNNIELNLLGHNFTSSCSPLQLGWTAGVRYLRFDESFLYSSDPDDVVFSGAPREVHYAINTQNNLVG